MKYLVPCLLVLPLMTSCVQQEQYYPGGYYNPPPRVEVQPGYPGNGHHHANNGASGSAPQARVYHGHTDINQNKVVVNPQVPQGQVPVQHNAPAQQNVHGQGGNNDNVVGHPPSSGNAVLVPGNVHGHGNAAVNTNNPDMHGKSQSSVHSHDDGQETVHGNN